MDPCGTGSGNTFNVFNDNTVHCYDPQLFNDPCYKCSEAFGIPGTDIYLTYGSAGGLVVAVSTDCCPSGYMILTTDVNGTTLLDCYTPPTP